MVSTRGLPSPSKPGATYECLLQEDTRKETERLIPIVKTMTGPGTGFTLKGPTAIGPICAYIASERLGNNDFSKESARKASCVNPKMFQETLTTIELVLSAHEKTIRDKLGGQSATYESLAEDYGLPHADFMVSCMQQAEQLIIDSGLLRKRIAPPEAVARVTIFMWVCGGLQQRIDEMELIRDFKLNEKDVEEVEKAIFATCRELQLTIRLEWRKVRKGLPTASTATTPSKIALSRTPSKLSPQRTPAKIITPQTRTPAQKTKITFVSRSTRPRDEEAMQVDETPSKKRKTSPSKAKDDIDRNAYSAFQAAMTTPSRPNKVLTSTLQASSSRLTLDLLESRSEAVDGAEQSDRQDEEEAELPAPGTDTEPSDVEMSGPEGSLASVAPTVATTPRRRGRPKKGDANQTPVRPAKIPKTVTTRGAEDASTRKAAMTRAREDYEEVPRERRNRPVLLCQQQWFMSDVRVEAEWEAREERLREWIESRGGRIPPILVDGRA